MSYIEPAPIIHSKDPLASMMKRFHVAAEHLQLDEEIYNILKFGANYEKIIINRTAFTF